MLPWLIAHGFLVQNLSHTPLPKGKIAVTFYHVAELKWWDAVITVVQ